MNRSTIGPLFLVIVLSLTLAEPSAQSEQLMPLDPVPPDYAGKRMPAGWWTDLKIIKEGKDIYFGDVHPLVACNSCHGQDGRPVNSGGGLRDQKHTSRFSDSYWYWRVAEGIPKTPMVPWKALLSEDQIWKVIAFVHTFSHKGKPSQHTEFKAESRPKKVTIKDQAPMVLVPAGEFIMGSNEGNVDEKPAHQVYLDAYYIDKHEVTIGQYGEFLDVNSFDPPPLWTTMAQPSYENRPVVNVDWKDASNYCKWAGKRLPTEAEWEKAARGTDGRLYPWGNDPPSPARANFGKERDKWNNHEALVPVGQMKEGKSPYGVYDLAGNVWEGGEDWGDPGYFAASPSRNPQGPANGKFKVIRGGSWDLAPERLRSVQRDLNIPTTTDYDSPAYRNFNSGFRCARNP